MQRSTHALVAVAAVAMLGLSACGGGAQTAATVDAPALSDINPKDRSELAEGGNLRIGLTGMPTQWNYIAAGGADNNLSQILAFTAPANFILDEAAVATPNPNYVTDVEVSEPDVTPQVVTLKLNPEAKWNSGKSITWADYDATVKACNGENEAFDCASTDGYNQVAKVEKGADEFEVKITFKSTYPDWRAAFSTVFAADAVTDPKVFAEGQLDGLNNEWQAGPFVVDKIDKNTQRVYLKRNDKWWGEKAILDTVEFHALEGDLVASAFGNSETDVASTLATADQLQKAMQRQDHTIRKAGSPQWRHFTFNSQSGLLADKALRQAIVRGINRVAIAESDLVGLPVEPQKLMLGNHFFMPGQEGYEDNSGDFAYDPERAAKELDELGWKLEDGKKFRMKDGQELKVEYAMLTGIVTSENEGKLFQSDMEKIGVNVVFKNVPPADFGKTLQEGNFGIIAFTWVGTPYPMNNIGQIYGCESESNYSKVCSKEIEKNRELADVELDKQKRIGYANAADKAIWDEVMTLPLYRRMEFTAVPADLANYGAFGNVSIQPENVGFVKK
ncbi:ABC transporter family substrate-binding protein [Gleimia coleocanis]|uniref:ABC transporter family substrate-binding protein n=1 Tax=Gleimia coleocanis TaxID=103618 RepID=UPI00031D4572|nr:ABC transporter family substrate-binding protein [Gleimia coleocanis]